MGRSIGSLGRQRDPLDLEFDYFGSTLRVHPHATDGVELEFLEAGRDIDTSAFDGVDLAQVDSLTPADQAKLVRAMGQATAAAYSTVLNALRRLIHPDDWDTYWRLGMEHGQQIRDRMADIKVITTAVVEETTDFPTGRPAASPTGPGGTPAASTGGSRSAAPASELEMALAMERGRPDLQEFYVMQAEDKDRAAQEDREKAARDQRQLAAAGLA